MEPLFWCEACGKRGAFTKNTRTRSLSPAVVLFPVGLFVDSFGEVVSNGFRFCRSYRLSLVRLQLLVVGFNWEIVWLQGLFFGHLGFSSFACLAMPRQALVGLCLKWVPICNAPSSCRVLATGEHGGPFCGRDSQKASQAFIYTQCLRLLIFAFRAGNQGSNRNSQCLEFAGLDKRNTAASLRASAGLVGWWTNRRRCSSGP